GLNMAIGASTGDVIVRVDGHTVVAPDYVRRCVELLVATSASTVGGRMEPVGSGLFGEAVALATTSRFGIGDSAFHFSVPEQWTDTVYMGAWWRRALDDSIQSNGSQVT